MPYAKLGVALQKAQGGQTIIDKLEKGETLTAAEEKKVEQAADKSGSGITEDQVSKILAEAEQRFENRVWESRKAERAMDELNKWAEKKYPGYTDLRSTNAWNQKLGTVLQGIENGSITVPDDWTDAYRYAVHETYAWVQAANPELGKKKAPKKTEDERRQEISGSQVTAGGVTPEDSEQLPEWARLDTAPRSPTGGRSFSSLKRN